MYVTRASRAHTNMNETKPPKLPRRARGTHMRARRGARARRSLFSRAFDTHDDGQLTDGQREERARTERPSERETQHTHSIQTARQGLSSFRVHRQGQRDTEPRDARAREPPIPQSSVFSVMIGCKYNVIILYALRGVRLSNG